MGKKTKVSSTLATCSSHNTEFSPEFRAAKAMFLLNEYMRYFSSLNGLCRQMVDVQREVLCRLGRSAWNNMNQEELDKTINKHFVNNFTGQNTESNVDLDASCLLPKSKSKSRRDSLQFITEDDGQDGFSGPFTWKSRSLQDLSFPSTPEMEIKTKQKQTESTSAEKEAESGSQDEDVIPSMTLDELRRELKRNYDEAQAARLKMQQMKSPTSKKPPEGITKTAVYAKLGTSRLSSVSSAKRLELNGMPLSPADLKPVSALKPVSQERLKPNPTANGSHIGESRQFHFRSPPEPLPRPKSHSRSNSSDKVIQGNAQLMEDDSFGKRTQSTGSYSGKSPRHGSLSSKSPRHDSVSGKSGKSPRHDSVGIASGKSPRHNSVCNASGKSPRHDSVGNASGKSPRHDSVGNASGKSPRHDSIGNASGKSPRHDSVSNLSGKSPRHDSFSKSFRSGSFSKKATSPDRVSVKEISEDLNQFFAGKTQSPNGSGDAELMELFKNW